MSASSRHPLLVALLSGPHTVNEQRLSLGFDPLQPGADVLTQVRLRLSAAGAALWRDLDAECVAVDTLLAWAGIDPASCRTEGGAINLPRLRALLADAPAPLADEASADGVFPDGAPQGGVFLGDDGELDCPFPDSVDALGSTEAAPRAEDDSHGFFEGAPGAPADTAASALSVERCSCRACRPVTFEDMRMVLCDQCGNKRCPHANDHRNACTNSNEAGQPGSAYPAASGVNEGLADPFEAARQRVAQGLPVADGSGYSLSIEPPSE